MKYSIAKPCDTQKQNLLPNNEGWYCTQCRLQVYDFEKMSNEEIIEKLSKGRVCASMKQTQTPSAWWRRAMILIGLSSFLNACQQRTTGEMTGKIQIDENSHAADTSESFSRQRVKGQLEIRESQTGKNEETTDTLKSSSEIDSGRLKN